MNRINTNTIIKKYDSCISLGWFCGTSSALSRLGLRSCSGPFDWFYSDFDSVLDVINNRFSDFMKKENLETISEKIFVDKKYGFWCNHDIEKNFEKECDSICEKYRMRSYRFLEMAKNPTLFFRAVRDEKEIEFINENHIKINEILKNLNKENEIVYVTLSNMGNLPSTVISFKCEIEQYVGRTYEMRHLFDNSEELLNFIGGLDLDCIKQNVIFDKNNNVQKAMAAYINHMIEVGSKEPINIFLTCIEARRLDKLYLWGAGRYGTILANYLKNNGIIVKAFIDSDKTGMVDDFFPIVKLNDVVDGALVFISIADKMADTEIREKISFLNKDIYCIGYKDIYSDEMDC